MNGMMYQVITRDIILCGWQDWRAAMCVCMNDEREPMLKHEDQLQRNPDQGLCVGAIREQSRCDLVHTDLYALDQRCVFVGAIRDPSRCFLVHTLVHTDLYVWTRVVCMWPTLTPIHPQQTNIQPKEEGCLLPRCSGTQRPARPQFPNRPRLKKDQELRPRWQDQLFSHG